MATNWDLLTKLIKISPSTLLFGVPGTGKTYAASHGIDRDLLFSITLTEETPAAELRGHFIPSEGGVFKWHDGPAIAAWRVQGARLVLNEINRASGDALTMLYAICDDPEFAQLTLPSGEKVRPAEGFHVIATMNGDPSELPEALADRFPVQIHVDQVAPGALLSLSEDLRTACANSIDSTDRISTRRWKRFDLLRSHPELDAHLAGEAVFGRRARSVLDSLKIASADGGYSDPEDAARRSRRAAEEAASRRCWDCGSATDLYYHDPRDNDPMCSKCYGKHVGAGDWPDGAEYPWQEDHDDDADECYCSECQGLV